MSVRAWRWLRIPLSIPDTATAAPEARERTSSRVPQRRAPVRRAR